MKNVFKVIYSVLCILGCLLGAGFISGAEIMTFFVRFGYFGIAGIIVSSVLFGIVIYASIRNNSNIGLQTKYNFLPYCQVFIAGAMLAGIVQTLCSMLNINYYLIMVIVGVALFFAIYLGINFANIFNVVVSVSTICVFPFIIKNVGINNITINTGSGLFFSIIYAALYVAMNSVACMTIIKSTNTNSRRLNKFIAIVSGIIMCVLLSCVYLLLISNTTKSDMPLLNLIVGSNILKYVYVVLFIAAMLSTLFSACSGAKNIFVKLDNNFLQSLCTCMAVICVSFIGFGKIINYTYPAIGIALFVQCVLNKMYKRAKKSQLITN